MGLEQNSAGQCLEAPGLQYSKTSIPNLKHPEKSSLIDLMLTNAPHKYSCASVFANDISDHCLIASVRNTKIPKTRPRIIFKRAMKQFSMQAFLHDLYDFDWGRISLIDDVENA